MSHRYACMEPNCPKCMEIDGIAAEVERLRSHPHRNDEINNQGMTIREHYAGLAMQGLLSSKNHPNKETANYAVIMADKLIEALNASK